jgi:hypothetical protein
MKKSQSKQTLQQRLHNNRDIQRTTDSTVSDDIQYLNKEKKRFT